MTPKILAMMGIIIHFIIVMLYDKVQYFQKYPKMYEDAIGIFFIGVYLICWQIEISMKG